MIEIGKPLTEQECQEARIAKKGIFPFKVTRVTQKRSDKVGDFFSMKLDLKIAENKFQIIFDSLFFTENMIWKTRHFYSSINRMDIYESGKFSLLDIEGLEGFCEVDHRTRKDIGEVEAYVKDYITPERPPQDQDFVDDDIPNI